MLRFITDAQDNMLDYVRDDPVRPEIPTDFRVSNGRFVAALAENVDDPEAMVCVSFHDFIPEDVEKKILAEYSKPVIGSTDKVKDYLINNKLKLLLAAHGEF